MGNFDFLRNTLPSLHQDCARAESYVSSDPRSACFYARRCVEGLVDYLFSLLNLREPYRNDLAAHINDAAFKVRIGSTDPRGFALVANATPLGMRESDPLPVQVEHLTAGQFVADVVTRPAEPPLIAAARAKGCGTMPGTGMFNAQAVLLAELLMGRRQVALD